MMTVRVRFMHALVEQPGSQVTVGWLPFDDLLDAFECPVNFVARDDERRREPDDTVVRFLAEQSRVLQGLAIGTGRNGQLEADPEPAAADVLDDRAPERAEPGQEVRAKFGGSFDELLVNEHLERRACHRAGQGVAAERAAVIAGPEDTQHLTPRQDQPYRGEVPRERLSDDHHVRLEAGPRAGGGL